MRLFLAIDFPESVKDQIYQTILEMKRQYPDGAYTCRENLHLTLVFIGETKRLNDVKKVMSQVNNAAFNLSFSGVGSFRRQGGDIFWLGVLPCPPLIALYENLSEKLKAEGFDIETRPYSPHLTLGRKISLPGGFDGLRSPDVSCFIDRFSLMKSERIDGKLVYTELFSRALNRV